MGISAQLPAAIGRRPSPPPGASCSGAFHARGSRLESLARVRLRMPEVPAKRPSRTAARLHKLAPSFSIL